MYYVDEDIKLSRLCKRSANCAVFTKLDKRWCFVCRYRVLQLLLLHIVICLLLYDIAFHC